MSKTLSLKMRDDVFSETKEVIETMHSLRNAYKGKKVHFAQHRAIIDALGFT